MTNGEFVSQIRGRLGDYRQDDRLPARKILATGLNIAATLHAQRFSEKKLQKMDGLYRMIPCVEMCRVDQSVCGLHIKNCSILMRSVEPLPVTLNGTTGNSVVMVTNVINNKKLQKYTFNELPQDTTGTGGRYGHLFDTEPGWFIFNNYLWITDHEILKVNVWLFTLQWNDTCDACASKWDWTFNMMDSLKMFILDYTEERFRLPREITKDESPDLNSNIKT